MSASMREVRIRESHDCDKIHPQMNHLEWVAQNKDAANQDKDPVGAQHEEVLVEDMSLAPKGKGRKAAKALYKEDEKEETEWAKSKKQDREAQKRSEKQHDEREARYQRQQAAAKKEDMSLAPKGKGRKAAKAMYGVEDIVKGISVSKKMAGTTVPPKQAPASQRMDKSKNLMPAPGWKTRKAGNKAGQMTTEDLEFKVTIKGIPPFYVPAKTAAAVKQSLRKQLKHPDDIQSIIRVTKSAQKIDYRKRAQGKSDEDENKK